MAKSVSVIIEDIKNLLNKNGSDVFTLSWPEFYKVVDRSRIKAEFTIELTGSMKAASLLLVYGNAVVLVAKDYCFAPLNRSK